MSDDRLPDTWIHMARTSYNPPGETPREEMWRALEDRLFADGPPAAAPSEGSPSDARPSGGPPTGGRRFGRWPGLLAAASVALLFGIWLGRGSTASDRPPVVAEAPTPEAATGANRSADRGAAVRWVTADHLTDTEALLAFVAADARSGRAGQDVGAWGQGLLTRTRLLLDSPAADDPAVRDLLEELEIVLAQVALLADPGVDPARVRDELDMIARGVDEGGVRGRIRSVLPSVNRGMAAADDD